MFLTKIDKLAPGSLLAAQQLDPRRLLGRRTVRDENKFFVTRAWRRFFGAVSDRTAQIYSLDENRPCFRSGGQRGGGSDSSFEHWVETILVQVFSIFLMYDGADKFGLSENLMLHSDGGSLSVLAGICALSYRYDRPIHRTSQFHMPVTFQG